ncbi:digestive organ expansion factor [Rhodofomes roseus]|uniref:U3 small nucleolar RNA-associated protein 25 n=1 Tax=Rhodofomes roseus TaxID=34475 RepID=A0ABQ8KLN7_9APHY|nr:digestive organ expansion factor [Rhodofomes roseus]KAH9839237.1 digestive organ expansion factor [Rhodofomes roseus]
MAIDEASTVTTKLLTLLNVSATKVGKRKHPFEDVVGKPSERLNKRRAISFSDASGGPGEAEKTSASTTQSPEPASKEGEHEKGEEVPEEAEGDSLHNVDDLYESHFGAKSTLTTETVRNAVDHKSWATHRDKHGRLGPVITSFPDVDGAAKPTTSDGTAILDKVKQPLLDRQAKLPREVVELQNDLLSMLSTQRDLYITRTSLDMHQSMREAITLHALNHITKKRRRVLKNNERLAHASKAGTPAPEDVQDQGFTRPSVLILLPFRSFAQRWITALTAHTPSPTYQVENRSRFSTEYGLPQGAVDKLANAEPGTYPRDHVEMFKGNIDDAFRMGVKMTRKSVKLFADFYGCDLIIASPLGLRMSIEKEKSADFLSSIEMVIVDQLDALTMQNWDHVQFVFSRLNQMPKESHDVDFSRIKPWYLDGHAAYLRQTILLTAYETPETRALFNGSLNNVAGKVRTERLWKPVEVPEGIEQNFVQFDCTNPKDELDKRFQYFTAQLLPAILKSAVQSSNTVIFIPSSFDFIRVQNHFRKNLGVTFTVLSEYSTNQDISRARQAFFNGKKAFLLVSERFHFFRRYKLRGIRNLVFYGPPEHAQFYTEFLSYPFLDDGVEAADVMCKVLYSKYDWLRLERIAGTEGAARLIKRGES